MLIFRFKILIRGCTRTGLHGLIFKKHHIFLILQIAAASLFTLCVVRSALELRSDGSYLRTKSLLEVAHAQFSGKDY